MTIESTEYRMNQRRAADTARRLRKAADRTAAQLGTLTTKPKTRERMVEYRRLELLRDRLDSRATYWENILKGMP